MRIKQKIKNIPWLYQSMLALLNATGYFDRRFWLKFPKYTVTELWKNRIDLVKQSPDNDKIDYAKDAGKIFNDHQRMHNGLKIRLGSYYDYGNTVLLQENKGVHEPQEEYVFQEVLKVIPDGGTIMELGSFWAFYSMWFAIRVKNATCIMIEPDPHKMNFGKLNFKMNNLNGVFELGFISNKPNLSKSIPDLTVDFLLKKHKIDYLDVLHSDIQGFELKMLHGASEALQQKKIGFLFISTHSNALHNDCLGFLETSGYSVICSANLDETYSWDGIIVAQAHNQFPKTEISKR